MNWYHYFCLVSLGLCLVGCIYHATKLIRLGKVKDFSPPRGKVPPAVMYSFTGAMHPAKKESAFLHLPTYTAGILYHVGTFLSFLLLFLLLHGTALPAGLRYACFLILLVSAFSGAAILLKRFSKKGLRDLSSPDDYISNLLVTIFQGMTALALVFDHILPFYCVLTGLLLLYLPIGKLKHTIYFFAARYHLGFFFGWRGVWPPTQINPGKDGAIN